MRELKIGDRMKFKKCHINWQVENFSDMSTIGGSNVPHDERRFDFESVKEYAFWVGAQMGLKTKVVVISLDSRNPIDEPAVKVVARNRLGHVMEFVQIKDLTFISRPKTPKVVK
jgi:hypothetical protein